jgi:hypothetical protein
MNNLIVFVWAGYLILLAIMIIFSAWLLSSERIGLGWKNLFIFLLGVSFFLALVTVIWIASNIENWLKA